MDGVFGQPIFIPSMNKVAKYQACQTISEDDAKSLVVSVGVPLRQLISKDLQVTMLTVK